MMTLVTTVFSNSGQVACLHALLTCAVCPLQARSLHFKTEGEYRLFGNLAGFWCAHLLGDLQRFLRALAANLSRIMPAESRC